MLLAEDEVCLVKNQTTASQNGPYLVKDGAAWERTCVLSSGMTVSVREGNTHARQIWMLVTNDPIEVDTTALTFEIVRAPGNAQVNVATTKNITLSGAGQTIDEYAAVAGTKILVKDQTTKSQNGIYVVAAGAWVRSDDPIVSGMTVAVRFGTVQSGRIYVLQTSEPITIGSTDLDFILGSRDKIHVVRTASQGNVSLPRSGLFNNDGITAVEGDRILLRFQTTPSQNGVYIQSTGLWIRDSEVPLEAGVLIVVKEGYELGRSMWVTADDTPLYYGIGGVII